MENKMTLKDAISILDDATKSVKADRREHGLILQAIDTLKKNIEEQEKNARSKTESNT